MKQVKIERCSHPGAWWAKHIGRTIRVINTDSYGHWTRDTALTPGAEGWEGYPFIQWVAVEDCSPSFDSTN